MKGVILCSDMGNRLNPITYTIPKQLIPVGNIPVLEYIIKRLVEAGITEIGIITCDNGRAFKGQFNNGKDLNCRLKYINQPKAIGAANAVLCAKDFIDSKDFLLISGECFFDFLLQDYIINFQEKKYDALIISKEFSMDDTDILESVSSTPQIYIFNNSIVKAASKIKPSETGKYELTDAIQYLMSKKYNIGIDVAAGELIKVDRVKDILVCNSHLLAKDGNQYVVGKGTEIENTIIGENTSIGGRCTIKNSVIYNSIIMDDCILNGVEVYDSIIGENSTIMGKGNITGVFSSRTILYINN